MKKSNKTGILVDGSLRSAGVTFYTHKTIVVENKDIGNYIVVPGGRFSAVIRKKIVFLHMNKMVCLNIIVLI